MSTTTDAGAAALAAAAAAVRETLSTSPSSLLLSSACVVTDVGGWVDAMYAGAMVCMVYVPSPSKASPSRAIKR